ncbi:MAG: S9 family peptidase [Dehalococcoidia bacterium]
MADSKMTRMNGLWPSPITPKSLAAALRLGGVCWDTDGRTLGWLEGRSDRGVIVVQDAAGGATRDLTPGGMSVRAFVGYGGGDFTLAHGAAYFVGQNDQRIYRQELAGGQPRPITPAFGAASTPVVSPDGAWVAYVHSYEDVDCLAVVPSDGSRWPERLASGCDFYMQPAWSPDGHRLAWVEWDHPHMPWDRSRVAVCEVARRPAGGLAAGAKQIVAGDGPDESVFQPVFTLDGRGLLFVSDGPAAETAGFGTIWRVDLATGVRTRISQPGGEFAEPAWGHGMRRFGELPSGDVVALLAEKGFAEVVVCGTHLQSAVPLSPAYTAFSDLAVSRTGRVALVAAAGDQPARVITVDPAVAHADVRKRSDSETVPAAALSRPQAVEWTSPTDGGMAYGLYFPPASERWSGPEGSLPPLVVIVHGGPTAQVVASWNAQAQFFATRGYAVLCPNYRGSTGYGRDYMLKLRESWGIFDVRDAVEGAQAMAQRGLADRTRLVIMGGSAGGFTVLQSMIEYPGFWKAGLCLFGVSNQFTLATDTHKFEQHYLDSIIGPLPQAAARYRERSPVFHADRIRDPLAVFQGDIDRVVPRAQSDTIVSKLRANGVPHEYHVYEGEGHGWRKSETIEQFYATVDKFLTQYVLFA